MLQLKTAKQYICEPCNFICSKQSNYNSHLSTRKHNAIQNAIQNAINMPLKPAAEDVVEPSGELYLSTFKPQTSGSTERGNGVKTSIYNCDCGSTYKHSSSYYRHVKSCNYTKPIPKSDETHEHSSIQPDSPDLYAIIQLLIKDNQEIRNLVLTQNNTLVDQNKTLTELVKNQQPTTNNNTTNTNSHNQNYNITMFLADKCKDAQNMSEFIEVLKSKVDMMQIYENGYVGGISKLFIDELKSMEVTERPLHCTDERRNTFYVHNNDVWNKDENLKDTKKAISHVSHTNLQQCVDWSKNVPESGSDREDHITKSIQLYKQACSGDDKNTEKIIKNISKEVPLNKQVIGDVVV